MSKGELAHQVGKKLTQRTHTSKKVYNRKKDKNETNRIIRQSR
jgi:hypothetical protein